MYAYSGEVTTVRCPDCNAQINVSYHDLTISQQAKCYCGGGYRFDYSAISRLRNAFEELESAKESILDGAEVISKK